MPRVIAPCILHALMANYHVVTVDLPGLGSRRGEDLNNESAIEAIRSAIVEKANGGKAIVFGYSMGTYRPRFSTFSTSSIFFPPISTLSFRSFLSSHSTQEDMQS